MWIFSFSTTWFLPLIYLYLLEAQSSTIKLLWLLVIEFIGLPITLISIPPSFFYSQLKSPSSLPPIWDIYCNYRFAASIDLMWYKEWLWDNHIWTIPPFYLYVWSSLLRIKLNLLNPAFLNWLSYSPNGLSLI